MPSLFQFCQNKASISNLGLVIKNFKEHFQQHTNSTNSSAKLRAQMSSLTILLHEEASLIHQVLVVLLT